MECAICMNFSVFPVSLKCSHIFCYLCVKGIANSVSNKCPLCRQRINRDILKRPRFVSKRSNCDRPANAFRSEQWFYEGKKDTGWWAYDHNSCQILEKAFNSRLKTCEIMISGVIYTVDFDNSVQYRNDMPSKKRRIRRDLLFNLGVVKGVAGVSKNLVEDVFGVLSSTNTSANNDISYEQKDLNIASNTTVSNIVEFEDENGVKIKKEIKTEIKTEVDD